MFTLRFLNESIFHLIINLIPMNQRMILTSDDRAYLLDQFQASEKQQQAASKVALLKIQSWKFARKTPEIGFSYLNSVETLVKRSFFNYIQPAHVLCLESYFFKPNKN